MVAHTRNILSLCAGVGEMTEIERKRELSRERNRKWREKHPDRARAKSKANVARWRANNPEESRAKCRAYYEANREHVLAQKRGYYQEVGKPRDATPEGRLKDLNKKHRRRTQQGTGNVSFNDWSSILTDHNYSCAYCKRTDRPLQMDHVIPLSKGGKHCPSNIVPACQPCNSSKGNR